MSKKRRNVILIVIFIVILIFILWISGIIPKQIAKISATHYLKKNFPEKQYELIKSI